MTSPGRNKVADDAYEEDAQKWARIVAPKLNASQRRSLAAQFRRVAREAIERAAEPEAKCKVHTYASTGDRGKWKCVNCGDVQ